VFAVEGELAMTPVAPQDAAMMQAAESAVLGQAPKGGTAAAMQSAARRNERLGVVPRDAAAEGGVAVTESRVPGCRVVTEFVADQVVIALKPRVRYIMFFTKMRCFVCM
jgi:hypothetical protein